jgi:hypothetical protein
MPLASVQCIAEAVRIPATTVFYILTEVLGLRFCHWRWLPRRFSDDQKAEKARQPLLILAALTAVDKRWPVNFWIMWANPPTGPWMTLEESPQRLYQTIRATKSMLTVFLNPKECALVNVSP